MNEQPQTVVRFYTLARKIPFLLGKLGDWVLPGGPYTLVQGVTFVVVAFIGNRAMPLLAPNTAPAIAWFPVLLVAGGLAVVAGHVPLKGRNPLMIAWGVIGYADAPAWGRQAGATVALKKTRRVKYRSGGPTQGLHLVQEPTEGDEEPSLPEVDHDADTENGRVIELHPTPLPTDPTPHRLTEVQQILAASAQRR